MRQTRGQKRGKEGLIKKGKEEERVPMVSEQMHFDC